MRQEVDQLRDRVRDLVVLSGLRASWAGLEPAAIVEGFPEVLRGVVPAELVFLRCRPTSRDEIEVLRTAGGTPAPDVARRIVSRLDARLKAGGPAAALDLPELPAGPFALRVVPLGSQGELGVLAVGSSAPGFPDELQRSLIGIGASQLSFALKERELFEHSREEFARRESEERDRRRAEEALRESEQRFRLAFDHAPIGMALVAPDGRWLQVNRVICELLGYPEHELLKLTFQDVTHPDDLDADLTLVRRVLAREIERYSMEKRYFHKLGRVVWILLHVSLVRDDNGEPLYFVAEIKDITESKRAEAERERLLAEVTTARERLEVLSRRLVVLQEEERRTIARELHDEVGQILTGLKLMLDTGGRPGAIVDLSQLRDVAGQLLERVKDLSLNLRPPMLDDLGLVPTLLWHFQRYRAQTGVEVGFHHRGVGARLPATTEITAFRIIQEALTNVARHAGTSEVTVELWARDDRLGLRVEDAGRGFDPGAPSGPSSGLTGMRERARLAGGALSLESRPGVGTRLEAELPLTGATAAEP